MASCPITLTLIAYDRATPWSWSSTNVELLVRLLPCLRHLILVNHRVDLVAMCDWHFLRQLHFGVFNDYMDQAGDIHS